MDLSVRIFAVALVFGLWILFALFLMSFVVPYKKPGPGAIGAFKTYWSEMLLVLGFLISAYLFLKGMGIL